MVGFCVRGRRGVLLRFPSVLLAVSLVAVAGVVAEPVTPPVALAHLPGYEGVDPALTASLGARAQAAADELLTPGEFGAEEGGSPEPVDDGQDVSVGHVSQAEVAAQLGGTSEVPEAAAYDGPAGFVEGESEVVSGTTTSLTYVNPDGSFTKEIFPGPSVYFDDTDGWTRFDPAPVVEGDRVVVPDARIETSFAAEGDAPRLVEVQSGWRSAGFALEGAADVAAVPTATGVRYPGILPGVDLVEHSVYQGVKEELVVAERPESAPVFRFRLSSDGLTPRVGPDNSIELVTPSGQVVFVIPEGTAWDSNTAQPEELNRVPVGMRLVDDGGVWVVELVPDWQWMSDPARVYPVVIDPQLVVTGSPTVNRDGWVWYQSPNVMYEGTTGSYSQWSASFNTYASRIGYTRVSGVWHQYRTYMYFAMNLPADTQVVTAATLEADVIYVRDYATDGTISIPSGYASTIKMSKVTSGWAPARPGYPSLTWNVQPTSDGVGYQTVAASQNGNLSANVLSWVQEWWANSLTNNGVVFSGFGYSLPGQGHGFTVLKALESDVPPLLRVTYVRPPQQVSPVDGYSTHVAKDGSVDFSWTEPDSVLTGHVEVCTDAAFTANCKISGTGLGTASIAVKLLPQNTLLYWRVRKPYGAGYQNSATRTLTLTNQSPVAVAPAELGEDGFFTTTTPSITVPASSDPENDPLQYLFRVCTQPNGGGDCQESEFGTSLSWTAGSELPWAQTYFWKVTVWDGLLNGEVYTDGLESTTPSTNLGATQWTLGTYPAGAPSGNVELASGNLSFEAVDVDPATVGVDIGASRTYNSRDDRVTGLFGQGWTHPADMWVGTDLSGNALVHLADGRTQFHGKSGDHFDGAWGATGTLTAASGGGYDFTLPSGVRYHFADGNDSPESAELQSIFDPAVTTAPALTTTLTWTSSTLIVRDEASGRSLTYTLAQSPGGSLHAVAVVPSGAPTEEWTYVYNADRLMKACSPDVDPSGSVHTMCTEYRYGPENTGSKITAVWSPQTTTGTARVPNVSPTNKKVLFSVTYDGAGQVVAQANGTGDEWTYAYSVVDQPITPPIGTAPTGVAKYKVIATTPRLGHTTYYFDATRRLLFQEGAEGAQQWWQYDERGFLTKTTTRLDAGSTAESFSTTAYTNDPAGLVIKKVNPNGAEWNWTYNSFGRVTKEIDPYGYTVDTGYAADGTHVISVTRRAAPTGTTELAAVGHGDAVTSYTYTDSTTPAYGSPTAHPPLWLPKSVTDERQQETAFQYDAGGDLRWTRTGNATQGYVYTRFTYDAVGRKLTAETSTDDANWTLIESNQYDPAGRLVITDGAVTVDAVTGDAHQMRVTTVYDDAGNALTITKSDIGGSAHPDASRTITYHYDDANRNDRVTDALGNSTDKEFDQDGNVSDTYDARGTHVVITHDLAGRELSTTLKDFVADPVGQPTVTRDVVLSSKTYDLVGHVVAETDALGRTISTTYDSAGMGWPVKVVLSVSSGAVNVLAATQYDKVGRMKLVERYGDPASGTALQRISTTYDLWGRAYTVTAFDAATYGAGNTTQNRVETNTYDVSGNVTETSTTGGTTTFLTRHEYLSNGLLANTTTENGATDITTSQMYDARGRVVSSMDAAGRVTTASYDVVGRVVSSTAPSAPVVTVNRDTGVAGSSTGAATSTVGYNTFGEVAHTQNALGEVTTTSYDVLGRKSLVSYPSYTPPGGSAVTPTESFAYDAVGNLVSSTNRLGETTTFTFDMMNRVVRQTDPAVGTAAAGVSTFTYDDAGNRLSVTNQVGALTEYEYDAMNQVITTRVHVRRDGGEDINETTVLRDLAGRPFTTCQPAVNGQTACSYASYSPMGEVLTTTDAVGNVTVASYDGLGRQVSVKDAAGHETVTGYDLAGRVSSVTHKGTNGAVVDTTTYQRDAAGNVTHVDLPGGGQFNYVFDAAGRMSSVSQLKQASPAAWITVSYGYDLLGRQVSSTDGNGNQWLTTYNTLGLVQDQVEPSTPGQEAIADRRFTTVYDAAGLVVEYQQPGGVNVAYSYDELARVTLETAAVTATSAAGTAGFGYDAAGRLTSFTAPQGDVSLTYDDRNLLLSASGEGVSSSFVYDARGRMTERSDAAGVSQYLWDAADRLVADTEPLTNTTRTYTWNTSNQVTDVSYSAGGMQRAYSYDTAGRLVSDTMTGNGSTQRQSVYAYDTAGRLVSETVAGAGSVVGQGVNSYTYDTAGRLVSWTAPSDTVTTYTWDDSGNRTSNGTVTSTYDARNRLTGSSNGDTYQWSPRGTMVSQTVGGVISDFTFDGLGRMVSAGGVGIHYDALDRIAQRSDGTGGWLDFSYSGLSSQPASDGVSLIARTPSGKPVAVKTGNASGVSVVADRHGDAVGTFDPTAGTVQGSVEFDPFGQVTANSGVQAGTVGYQGAYTDPTSGLVDMGARWYQPSTGRFTARDTIRPMLGSPISLNMYTYANDDPLGFYDPDGHCAVKIDGNFCAPTKKVRAPTGSGAHAFTPPTKAHEPMVRCTHGCPDGETQMMPAWTQQPPPDPILVCAANPSCSAQKMVQLIKASKNGGLGELVFALIEGADNGKLDGNWGQKSVDAAAKGGPELVVAIMNEFDHQISKADARQFAKLAQAVAKKIQHAKSDFEKIDHEKSTWERVVDKAKAWAGPVLGALVTWGCFAFAAAGALETGGATAVAAAGGCTAAGGAVNRSVTSWANGGGFTDGLLAAGDPAAIARDFTIGAATQALTMGVGNMVSQFRATEEGLAGLESAAESEAGSLGGSFCHSFGAATRVEMADGTTKRIDEVRVGDSVAATEVNTGREVAGEVSQLHRNFDSDLVDLTVENAAGDRTIVHTTSRHAFWSDDRSTWVEAAKLAPGEELEVTDGSDVVSVMDTHFVGKSGWMYDLTVDEVHTFHIVAAGAPVLVHNCGEGMLGENGTQVTSKTLTKRPGYRIDVENPAPGVRPGQLHLQDAAGGKYLYNFESGAFEGIPSALAKQIARDPAIARAIVTGGRYLGVPV